MDAGLPVSAWSGLTVYGDGSLAPIAPVSSRVPVAALVGVLLLVALTLVTLVTRRLQRG